ncbi:vacuolar protein-sorting-associated protein 36 [Coccinella septempunctata]|uniref:vacuolar protein-sorting-associated protein 36 n=1 Tax=Coccinella septempunctata TaxID=41139 RepID=UPI001D0756EB|nr:vacuolar protein-sorting-associated protein 36 [Coccinella septempunctata]
MNRFRYASPILIENEYTLTTEKNVRLYDGDQKTAFEGGELIITSHRILWGKPGAIATGQTCLVLSLSLVVYMEEESPGAFSFSNSRKIVLFLSENVDDQSYGPQQTSVYNFIKLSFRDGYQHNVLETLNHALQQRAWETKISSKQIGASSGNRSTPMIKLRTGIVGIERNLQEKQKAADESITVAFQDLSKLMTMAKDMVKLSQTISTKIKEKQGDITDDDTVKFKSYLLSLGIDDPVTRDSYKSNTQYYRELAKEICNLLREPIDKMGGMMGMTDVFCRINRARGLELLSPEDTLNACKAMETLNLPLKLYQFASGVMVLQLSSLDDEIVTDATAKLIEEKKSLTCDELATHLGISIVLAKERLLSAEKVAKCCRDDSIEGLRFYPNLFLMNTD